MAQGTFVDREFIYRVLVDNMDRNNILVKKQGALAKELGLTYQHMCIIINLFIDQGLMRKTGVRFQVLVDPDDVDWSDEAFQEQSRGRRPS